MKRKTALAVVIAVSATLAVLTLSTMVHAEEHYSLGGKPYSHLSPSEPIYCKPYKASGSLVCTVETNRKFNDTVVQLVARSVGKMVRPNERVEISPGVIDVRAVDNGKLSRIYVATNQAYAKL